MKKTNQAFTLVELIVVITILAILWTIAFISLQWYSKDTRNSVRLSDMSNINKMLWVKIVTAGKVPLPDNYVEITASGTVLNYQWEAWERVLEQLWVSNGWKDPKDETYYTYSTNTNLTKYQLLGFMEWDPIASVVSESFAVSDLSDRAVKVYWDDVWILLENVTNLPVTLDVDVVTTSDTYKIIFTDESLIEATGSTLFSNIYNRNKVLLNNKDLAKLDDSLVAYWDMESMTWSYLKDLSQYWNYWTLNGSLVVWWEDWKNWKATYFDWIDDFIQITNPNLINDSMSYITISAWVRLDAELWSKSTNYPIVKSWVTNAYWFEFRINDWIEPSNYVWKYQFITDNWSYTSVWSDEDTYPNDHSWTYLTAVLNGTNWTIYMNWNFVSDMNSILQTPWSVFISNNWSQKFHWIIDDIRIYNRALSENEVQALYSSTK